MGNTLEALFRSQHHLVYFIGQRESQATPDSKGGGIDSTI